MTRPLASSDPLEAESLRRWAGAVFALGTTESLARSDPRLARLVEVADRVRAAWPEAADDLDGFFVHLASRLPTGDARQPALEAMHVEDLYLAYACSRGDPWALRALDEEVRADLEHALGRLRVPRERHDDLQQELWRKLCVADTRPKILEYSGRSKLRSWFRVTAIRLLIDDRRRQRPDERQAMDAQTDALVSPAADPEIEYLKRLYSREFDAAFREAVAALPADARNVLRSYYRYDMTVDQIAAAYGTHRATAARRVQRAREGLLEDTRRRLAEHLHLQSGELDSILRLIASRLHVSLHRLLD